MARQESLPRVTGRRLILLVGGVVGGAGLWLLWRYDPATVDWFPQCPTYSFFGVHCPGCGTTRALHALLNADLPLACRYNPLLIVGGPFLLVLLWWNHSAGRLTRPAWATKPSVTAGMVDTPEPRQGNAPKEGKSTRATLAAWVPMAMLGLLVVYTLLRNLPSPQTAWLAPP